MDATRFLVEGQVQGVRFRASTRDRALALGLHGHARNLPDGRVEVLVAGDAAAVETLATWLTRGPQLAEVTRVSRSVAHSDDVPAGFVIG